MGYVVALLGLCSLVAVMRVNGALGLFNGPAKFLVPPPAPVDTDEENSPVTNAAKVSLNLKSVPDLVDDIDSSLDNVTQQFLELKNYTEELHATVQDLKGQLEELKATTGQLEATTQLEELESMKGEITSLQGSVGEVTQLTESMQGSVGEIAQLSTDIELLQESVGQIPQLTLDVDSWKGDTESVKEEMGTLKEDVDSMKEDQKTTAADVQELVEDQQQTSAQLNQATSSLQEQSLKVDEMNSILNDLVQDEDSAGGAVFTRWGRNDCPSDTEQLYAGYAGGSSYKEIGGSAELLCLPDEPLYEETTDGVQGWSYIYAVEYESEHTRPNVDKLNDHDMPCAVCLKRQHKTTLMVPARNVCYQGWTLQYKGYLWGGPVDRFNYDYAPKDYICVDQNSESVQGGNPGGQSKVAMYLVEGRCDSQGHLCLAGYKDGWELTCAVCTL